MIDIAVAPCIESDDYKDYYDTGRQTYRPDKSNKGGKCSN
jgi:hypothetical protein